MNVLVCGNNRILSDLVTRNLVHRGFDVRELPLPRLDASHSVNADDSDLIIIDFDDQEPELWWHATRVRTALPGVPLVILGHAWPASPRLDQLQPCAYVRKPFSIDDLLAAVQDGPTSIRSAS